MGFAMIWPWATGQESLSHGIAEASNRFQQCLSFAANAVWDERERDKDRESNKINNYAVICNNK